MDLSVKLQKIISSEDERPSDIYYTARATATDGDDNTTTPLQDLIMSTNELELGWTLPALKYNRESTLHLALIPVLQMNIFVTTSAGKTITLDVTPYYPISSVKHTISKKIPVDIDKQMLFFNEKLLEDDKQTLDYYGIKKGSILVVRMRDAMHVMVRMPDGETLGFEVLSSDTVDDVKLLICVKKGIHPKRQVFNIGRGEEVSHETLGNLGIKNGTVIDLHIPEYISKPSAIIARPID